MADTTLEPEDHVTVSVGDDVLFRLHEGTQPLACPDTITRVSYEVGISVIHIGTVWVLGYYNDVEALELEDGTVVALEDIDPRSVVVTPAADTDEGGTQ
jgi:hypothetical protein